MSEKYDFSKIEDRQEFEQLPQEEKEAIVDAAQEEAIDIDAKAKEVINSKAEEDKYSPEAIREEIKFKAEKIRNWAGQMGLSEGKDFKIIESIEDIETDADSIAPHERKEFFIVIHEDFYRKFKEYILGQYSEERKKENPDNKYGCLKLDYSWGGRFAVINDGVFFDTVAASSVENLAVPTHQEEFKSFFKQKAGFDFPTSDILNPMLKEMNEKGIGIYESALKKLEILKKENALPDDGYGLIDAMEHMIKILKYAKNGEAVIDLPEILRKGKMPHEMRHYADLTYNAEDVKNFDRVTEITRISFPDEIRIDKIFDRYGFNRKEMETICKDFSDYIMVKRELEKNPSQ